jgi:hypothetical protein
MFICSSDREGDYFIGDYWWLLVAIGGYWWLLVAILLMAISDYSINGY